MTSGLFADALFSDSAFLDYARINYGTYYVTCLRQLTHILDFGQFAQLSGALFWDSGLSLALWARPFSLLDNSSSVRFVSSAQVALCSTHSNMPVSLISLFCADTFEMLAHLRYWPAGFGSLLEFTRLAIGLGSSPALGLGFEANSFQGSVDSRVPGIFGSLCVRCAPYPSTLAFQDSVTALALKAEGCWFFMLNLCYITPASGLVILPLISLVDFTNLTNTAAYSRHSLGFDVGFLGPAESSCIPALGPQLGAWLFQDPVVPRSPGAHGAPFGFRGAMQRFQGGRLDLACSQVSAARVASPSVPMALHGCASFAPGSIPGWRTSSNLTGTAAHARHCLGLDMGFLGTAESPCISAPGLQHGAWLSQDLFVLRPLGAHGAPAFGSRGATQHRQGGCLELACPQDSVALRPPGAHGAPAIGSRGATQRLAGCRLDLTCSQVSAARAVPPSVPMALPGRAPCGDSVVDVRALGTLGGSPLPNYTQDGEGRHGFLLVDFSAPSQSVGVLGHQPGIVLTSLSDPLCADAGAGELSRTRPIHTVGRGTLVDAYSGFVGGKPTGLSQGTSVTSAFSQLLWALTGCGVGLLFLDSACRMVSNFLEAFDFSLTLSQLPGHFRDDVSGTREASLTLPAHLQWGGTLCRWMSTVTLLAPLLCNSFGQSLAVGWGFCFWTGYAAGCQL